MLPRLLFTNICTRSTVVLVSRRNVANQELARKDLPSEADIVVIGGGSIGCSTLYHLAHLGGHKCVLLERDKLTSGTTWHTAGLLWRRTANDVYLQLVERTRILNEEILSKETGVDTNWIRNGAMFVATKKERMNEYNRLSTLAKYLNIDIHIVSPKEAKDIHPLLNVDDLHCAMYSPGDGVIDANSYCQALVQGAKAKGARVFEHCTVTGIETAVDDFGANRMRAVHTTFGTIKTKAVVNCCGVWAPKVGAMAGVKVPLLALKHAYVVTESVPGLRGLPNVRDQDSSIYFRVQGDAQGIGGYEPNPSFWDDVQDDFAFSLFQLDWNIFEQHLNHAVHRMPVLAKYGVRSEVCGPEAFTPDHRPLMGESPEVRGFFLGCGFNSGGMMTSGGAGQQLANWVVNGRPDMYMYNYDIRRYSPLYSGNQKYIKERSHESYANNHSIGWPNDESLACRNIRKDPLYDTLLSAGCVFQERLGMERPGWFALDGKTSSVLEYDWYGAYDHTDRHKNYPYYDRLRLDYTFGFPKTHDTIGRECRTCREKAAIFNMTSFSRFVLTGPDSGRCADWIFANNIRKPVGTTIYTCILNKFAGVESDLTVSVIEHGQNASEPLDPKFHGTGYYITASGSTAYHVYNHMMSEIQDKKFKVNLKAIDDLALLSVQGPNSRHLLQPIVDCDLSDKAFPFSTNRLAKVGGHVCRVLRLSFVGELGFELHVPYPSCQSVFDEITKAGGKYGLANAGFRAIYSLSAEKGYRLWGTDLRNTDTPLESGLGFTCKLKSDTEFLGRESLQRQKKRGIDKKLVCFTLKKPQPLWGLEVILRNGQIVGYIRRVEYAHTLGATIAYGYIEKKNPSETLTNEWLGAAEYEIESMGQRLQADLHLKHPFDPENNRLKGIY